jgi:pimeloyl-ACP methyl ester carboxylesterase
LLLLRVRRSPPRCTRAPETPDVVGLVYVAAFGLDEGGESIGTLLAKSPGDPALAHLDVDQDSFAWMPEDDFVNHFAADVDPGQGKGHIRCSAAVELKCREEVMGGPARRSLPSWFMIADGDQVIPPDARRQFAARMGATTVEVSTNHVAMASHPDDVLQLIGTAVEAVSAAT